MHSSPPGYGSTALVAVSFSFVECKVKLFMELMICLTIYQINVIVCALLVLRVIRN